MATRQMQGPSDPCQLLSHISTRPLSKPESHKLKILGLNFLFQNFIIHYLYKCHF